MAWGMYACVCVNYIHTYTHTYTHIYMYIYCQCKKNYIMKSCGREELIKAKRYSFRGRQHPQQVRSILRGNGKVFESILSEPKPIHQLHELMHNSNILITKNYETLEMVPSSICCFDISYKWSNFNSIFTWVLTKEQSYDYTEETLAKAK